MFAAAVRKTPISEQPQRLPDSTMVRARERTPFSSSTVVFSPSGRRPELGILDSSSPQYDDDNAAARREVVQLHGDDPNQRCDLGVYVAPRLKLYAPQSADVLLYQPSATTTTSSSASGRKNPQTATATVSSVHLHDNSRYAAFGSGAQPKQRHLDEDSAWLQPAAEPAKRESPPSPSQRRRAEMGRALSRPLPPAANSPVDAAPAFELSRVSSAAALPSSNFGGRRGLPDSGSSVAQQVYSPRHSSPVRTGAPLSSPVRRDRAAGLSPALMVDRTTSMRHAPPPPPPALWPSLRSSVLDASPPSSPGSARARLRVDHLEHDIELSRVRSAMFDVIEQEAAERNGIEGIERERLRKLADEAVWLRKRSAQEAAERERRLREHAEMLALERVKRSDAEAMLAHHYAMLLRGERHRSELVSDVSEHLVNLEARSRSRHGSRSRSPPVDDANFVVAGPSHLRHGADLDRTPRPHTTSGREAEAPRSALRGNRSAALTGSTIEFSDSSYQRSAIRHNSSVGGRSPMAQRPTSPQLQRGDRLLPAPVPTAASAQVYDADERQRRRAIKQRMMNDMLSRPTSPSPPRACRAAVGATASPYIGDSPYAAAQRSPYPSAERRPRSNAAAAASTVVVPRLRL